MAHQMQRVRLEQMMINWKQKLILKMMTLESRRASLSRLIRIYRKQLIRLVSC